MLTLTMTLAIRQILILASSQNVKRVEMDKRPSLKNMTITPSAGIRLKTKTGNYSQVVNTQEHDPHMISTEANAVLDHPLFY